MNNDQEALAKEIIAELDAGGDFAKIAAEKSRTPARASPAAISAGSSAA